MGVKNSQYRNQTQLHQWLTGRTFQFLNNMRTQKGLIWRQEHTIHNGMRPDAVGFCSLKLYHEKNLTKKLDRDFFSKIATDYMFVFESKVSYQDFKSTFNGNGKDKEQSYANFHFLVLPRDFSRAYDLSTLPDYWGILEPNVSALQVKKYPRYIEIDRLFFLEAAYTMLFKRDDAVDQMEKILYEEQNIT